MEPSEARFPRIVRAMVERIGGEMIVAEGGGVSHILSTDYLLEDNRLCQAGIESNLHRALLLAILRTRCTVVRLTNSKRPVEVSIT